MYHTISNINQTINLQQYIDNKCGIKRIGLKSFTYTIGWYNLIDEYIQKTDEDPNKIKNGYYSFHQIADIFQSNKVQVGKDQEKAQSERDSHSKNRGGKKPN